MKFWIFYIATEVNLVLTHKHFFFSWNKNLDFTMFTIHTMFTIQTNQCPISPFWRHWKSIYSVGLVYTKWTLTDAYTTYIILNIIFIFALYRMHKTTFLITLYQFLLMECGTDAIIMNYNICLLYTSRCV